MFIHIRSHRFSKCAGRKLHVAIDNDDDDDDDFAVVVICYIKLLLVKIALTFSTHKNEFVYFTEVCVCVCMCLYMWTWNKYTIMIIRFFFTFFARPERVYMSLSVRKDNFPSTLNAPISNGNGNGNNSIAMFHCLAQFRFIYHIFFSLLLLSTSFPFVWHVFVLNSTKCDNQTINMKNYSRLLCFIFVVVEMYSHFKVTVSTWTYNVCIRYEVTVSRQMDDIIHL